MMVEVEVNSHGIACKCLLCLRLRHLVSTPSKEEEERQRKIDESWKALEEEHKKATKCPAREVPHK